MNHRQLGVDLYNGTWLLLEKERTPEEDDELVHQAHASAYHWSQAPECEPKNRVRGEWLCSRVYAVLGRGESALHHAERALATAEASPENMEEWDLPFVYEALARAYGVAGNAGEAERYEKLAREATDAVTDEEDKEILLKELATL
jgi:hypothetical protein